MRNTHGGSVCDHIHRLIHNSDRKFKYRISICIDGVISSLSHFHIVIMRTTPFDLCICTSLFYDQSCRRCDGCTTTSSFKNYIDLVSSIAHVHFHGLSFCSSCQIHVSQVSLFFCTLRRIACHGNTCHSCYKQCCCQNSCQFHPDFSFHLCPLFP